MPTSIERFREALRDNAVDFGIQLHNNNVKRLSNYYELLLKWNNRLHLVAPCPPAEFATRHVLESLMVLRHLPPHAHVVDIGSGAGLPIIPCLIARDDLDATLIESSRRKSVYLREALRRANVRERAGLIVARFQETTAPQADFVTCRALDRFAEMLPKLIAWSPPGSKLLLFAGDHLCRQIETLCPGARIEYVPQSKQRFLVIAESNPPV